MLERVPGMAVLGGGQAQVQSESPAASSAAEAIGSVRETAAELTALFSPADILLVLLILVATHFFIRALTFLAHALSARLTRHRLLLLQSVPLMRISLWLLSGYLIVAGVFEPSRESLIAFFATAGIGIGFAAQDVLKNIFGGILIVADRPFQVGDLVDIGGHHGEVVGIGLRATRILTRDDAIIAVPNSEVVSQAVRNANPGALDCMVVTELYLPGLVDTGLVEKLCREAAASSPYLYAGKPISIAIQDEFRETFLTRIRIRAYVYDHRLEVPFSTEVARRAKRAFLEARLLPAELVLGVDPSEEQKYLVANSPADRVGTS